jgi:hypothetical protein
MNKENLLRIIASCMAISLALFAYLGLYIRYLADDFCTANIAIKFGVVGSVLHWYNTYAGQFTNWTLKGLIGSFGPSMATLLPGLIILTWAGAATWMCYQLNKLLQMRKPFWVAVCLGMTLVYAIFAGAPSLIQSLYWHGASIPYTLPLIVLTFYGGLVVYLLRMYPDGKLPGWAFVATAILLFIAGGTSEVYVLFQTAVLALSILGLLLVASPPVRHGGIKLLALGLVCSVLAFVVILASSGNSVRLAMFGDRLPLIEVGLRTLRVTASFFATAIGLFSPLPLLVSLLVPIIIISQLSDFEQSIPMSSRRARKYMGLSSAIALLLIFVIIGAPIYATAVAPAPRVYLVAQLVMVMTAGFWGCIIGLDLRRTKLKSVVRPALGIVLTLALLMVAGPLATSAQSLSRVSTFQTFAEEWDARDHLIRQAASDGVGSITVEPLSVDLGEMAGLDTIGDDPAGWVNVCAASYYGVDSITAEAI